MSEFKEFYYSIPYFTRWWLTLTIGLSLLVRLQLLRPEFLILAFETVLYKFHIWRPITCLFFAPLGLHFLFCCFFIYNYSSSLETGIYAGKPADYFFMLLFCWICSLAMAVLFNFMIIVDVMVMSVIYMWSLMHKDTIVSFWFGTRFKAMYLPWVYLGFNFISGGGAEELAGIVVGHLAYFTFFKYPQDFGGQMLFQTPMFLRRIFPDSRVMGSMSGPQAADPARQPHTNTFGGHQWGRGQVLGGN